MAILRGSVVGNFSGKLGNLAARIRYGRTILSARPASFHVSNVPALVEIRKKFAVTGIFAKNIITLAALLSVWDKVKTSGMSAFNYAFQQNFDNSSVDKPTVDNFLTPMTGFPLPVSVAAVTADAVTATIDALDTVMIASADERDVVPSLMICFYNPADEADAPYAVIPVQGASQVLDTINPIALNIPLNIVQQNLAAKYQNSILYLALTTHDADGKVVQYSATYTQDN